MGKTIETGIIASFGNQKGGVGKTVITSLVANYIHNNYKKLKIVVIDADDLQSSLYSLRQKEIENLSEKEKKSLYRLLKIGSKDLPSQIEILQEEYDIIFVDLPGNLKQPGVITAYYLIDLLFIPSQASSFDLDSTMKFISLYNEVLEERKAANAKTKLYGIFSRVDPQNRDFKNLYANKDNFEIPFLNNYIPESKVAFQRNVSTIETYENNRQDYTDICEEVISLILKFASDEK